MLWSGEMAQELRILVLAEDPDLISSTHMVANDLSVTPVPRDPVPSSDPQGHQACT